MSFTDKFDAGDYYLSPEGYVIFTEQYHLKRGYCCQNGCRHCPYGFRKPVVKKETGDSSKNDNN